MGEVAAEGSRRREEWWPGQGGRQRWRGVGRGRGGSGGCPRLPAALLLIAADVAPPHGWLLPAGCYLLAGNKQRKAQAHTGGAWLTNRACLADLWAIKLGVKFEVLNHILRQALVELKAGRQADGHARRWGQGLRAGGALGACSGGMQQAACRQSCVHARQLGRAAAGARPAPREVCPAHSRQPCIQPAPHPTPPNASSSPAA